MPTLPRRRLRSAALAGALLTALTGFAGTVAVPAAHANTLTSCSEDLTVAADQAIPDDNGVTSVSLSWTFEPSGPITHLTVTVDISHTYVSDVYINLLHGDANLDLTSFNGGSGDNYTNTTFDDDAATSITAGTAPFTGSYQPEQSLSDLNGIDANGGWVLQVKDVTQPDAGVFHSATIHITYDCSGGDVDVDGILNGVDNCATKANGDQADADADGQGNVCDSNDDNDALNDSADSCDLIAAATASGCPLKARSLTAAWDAGMHAYAGRLHSSALPACHVKRTVSVWKAVAGPDQLVGKAVTNSTGQWMLAKPRAKGSYWAGSARVVVTNKGECARDVRNFTIS